MPFKDHIDWNFVANITVAILLAKLIVAIIVGVRTEIKRRQPL